MFDIYGVEVQRVKGKAMPVLCHAKARATVKLVIVEGSHSFLGYRSHIPKTERLHCSPRSAWEAYVERCNSTRLGLRMQAEVMAEFQQIGIQNILDLGEADC